MIILSTPDYHHDFKVEYWRQQESGGEWTLSQSGSRRGEDCHRHRRRHRYRHRRSHRHQRSQQPQPLSPLPGQQPAMARKLAQQRDSPAHQVGALKSTNIIFFVVKFYFIYRNIECVLQTTNGVFYMLSTIKVKFAISSATILAIGRFCKYPQPPNKSL